MIIFNVVMLLDVPELNFPEYTFQFIQDEKGTKIFDSIRKQYVVLTPEEWVRQHLIRYMIQEAQIPKGLIAVEKGLKINGMMQRTDVLVYDRNGTPWMVAECKAPSVKKVSEAAYQASRYCLSLNTPFILVTNGLKHGCYRKQGDSYHPIKEFPSFSNKL